MENLDKTMFTNNEQDLQQIYEEESQKLHQNVFKLDLLKKLTMEDFPEDLPEASKKNLEKALLAVKIKDHITLENGQKLLGLDNFDMSKIQLSYIEKKLIRERVEHLLNLEKKKQDLKPKSTNELAEMQKKFIELHKENIAMTETLAQLKKEELDLLREVAEVFVSPTQTQLVQGILDDAKIVQLKVKNMNQVLIESEMSKTAHFKKALTEVSKYIDDELQKK